MTDREGTVYVLGAGFTRAFYGASPLMADLVDIEDIEKEAGQLPLVKEVLEAARERTDGKINIEWLMTRLEARMPYDKQGEPSIWLDLVLSRIRDKIKKRILDIRNGYSINEDLKRFAARCLEERAHILTFNYDDILDEHLWAVKEMIWLDCERMGSVDGTEINPNEPYWHPDGGYGFFCKPSVSLTLVEERFKDEPTTTLLKLHGSINWYLKRGASSPYSIDDIVCHVPKWQRLWQNLSRPQGFPPLSESSIERHLESDPFFVAPVFAKTALTEQPILRLVWTLAYEALSHAARVFIVGYSMPESDLATRSLFAEALSGLVAENIFVINKPDPQRKNQLINSHKRIADVPKRNFIFQDAAEWCRERAQSH